MVRTLLALCFIAGLPVLANAKAFKIGDGDPVSWVSVPDTWEPAEIDNGVEGTSPDKETYVAAEIVDAKEIDEAVKEEDKFFTKQKIKIKPDTKKEKETTVNGLKAFDYSWDATDEDGPTHVSVTFVVVAEDKLLLLTYWGSAAGEKSNGKDLVEIAQSIKPIK
jgi:PAB1-binding protein PBP1